MELTVHELKFAREKMSIKHLGSMRNVEKEIEEMSTFLSSSGRIDIAKLKNQEDGEGQENH
jgi:hypothetical protein